MTENMKCLQLSRGHRPYLMHAFAVFDLFI